MSLYVITLYILSCSLSIYTIERGAWRGDATPPLPPAATGINGSCRKRVIQLHYIYAPYIYWFSIYIHICIHTIYVVYK